MSNTEEVLFDRFSDRACKVLGLASMEAQRFNHNFVGTEHILLGLIQEGSGVAASVLRNLDIDLDKIRREVEKIVQSWSPTMTVGQLPFTPRAKKVLELAVEEASSLGHNYIGTEHLLLGLIRENEGVAAQVLLNLGLKLEEVKEIIGSDDMNAPIPPKEKKGEEPQAIPSRRGMMEKFLANLSDRQFKSSKAAEEVKVKDIMTTQQMVTDLIKRMYDEGKVDDFIKLVHLKQELDMYDKPSDLLTTPLHNNADDAIRCSER